jgi:hypothetical protein
MVQSPSMSRFNSEISRLQAGIVQADAALSRIRGLQEARNAASLAEGRGARTPDQLNRMRIILWMTAVSALAALLLILL